MNGRILARSRRAIAPTRQAEAPIRIFALDLHAGVLVPPKPHGWSHLVTVRSGSALVRTHGAATTIVPAIGMWIPEAVDYELAFRSRAELRIVYASPQLRPAELTTLDVHGLLHELIERATASGYLDPANERDARITGVMCDEIAHLELATSAASLALPRDAGLLASIARYCQAIDEMPAIPALAAAAHMSPRTFERRFAAETGCTPREWLQRARLVHAMASLAAGASVTEAGLACGYASTSAFIAAFRGAFGTTPGRARMRVRPA